jgi:plasmid stabilization system protein ParE
MKRLEFSRAACRDRDAILDYTLEKFGTEQAIRLGEALAKAMERLQRRPGTGRLRPDLSPTGRTIRWLVVLESFLVVYEATEAAVRVARIVHAARDLPTELRHEEGSA